MYNQLLDQDTFYPLNPFPKKKTKLGKGADGKAKTPGAGGVNNTTPADKPAKNAPAPEKAPATPDTGLTANISDIVSNLFGN